MPKTKSRLIFWSATVLVWVNALPYLSRLTKGLDWATQYLPDEGALVPGLIFFHVFYSTPAIPLITSLRESEKPGLPWTLALAAVTALTWAFHKDYDLAADAQAATGLVILPLVTMGTAYIILAVCRSLPGLPSRIRRVRKSWKTSEKPSSASYSEGGLAFSNGKQLNENPYPENGPQFHEWNDGWKNAFESRQEMENDRATDSHGKHQ